jgi:DNA-binding LacI/PurR family transcriptional regulator
MNLRIARALDDAHIPVVLLDRTVLPYPQRGHHDLVGIDNRRAGYVITEHLLRLGARRIAFLAMPHAAATVDAREAGYREALYTWQAPIERSLVHRLDPSDSSAVESLMQTHQVEAIVCANDRTASRLIPTLLRLGCSIPDAVRVVGIDDLEYAEFLPVPLTTLRQPTRQLGDAALAAMLERVARTHLPTRDILLNCELIVRESCGAKRRTEDSDKRPPSM